MIDLFFCNKIENLDLTFSPIDQLVSYISILIANRLNGFYNFYEGFLYKLEKNNLQILDKEENIGNDLCKKLLSLVVFLEKKGEVIKYVDFSDLVIKDDINKNRRTIEKLHKITRDNFPIVGIERIGIKEKVFNIRFLGIKKINDNISKEFTDFLVDKIKEELNKNLRNNFSKKGLNGREISNDYKNICFSLENIENIGEKIFGINDISIFLEKIINSLDNKKFNYLIKNSNFNSNNKKDIKDFIKQNFGIGVGSYINKSNNLDGKNISHFKATVSSKNKIYGNIDLGIKNYSFKEIENFSFDFIKKYNIFIDKYEKEFFNFDGGEEEHKIIFLQNGKKIINPIFINKIKKGKKLYFKNFAFENIKKEFLEIYDGFKNLIYFVPILEGIKKEKFVEKYKKSIELNYFDINYFIKNFKGFYNKKYLDYFVENKKGIKIFIDIIGNSVLNFYALKSIAEKINSGEINSSNVGELLSSTNRITKQILEPFYKFLKKYKNAKIAVAGDEFFIFIPGVEEYENGWNKKETYEILNFLTENIFESGFNSRIIYSYDKNINFDQLDFLTNILNKLFEEKLENKQFGLKRNITLTVDDDLKKKILLKEINIQKIIEKINTNNLFLKMIRNNKNINGVFIIVDNYKITFLKTKDNLEIKIDFP